MNKKLDEKVLKVIRQDLITYHSRELLAGLFDLDVRRELVAIIMKEHKNLVERDEEIARMIVNETVGTGVIENFLKDPEVTDIGWNGEFLVVEAISERKVYSAEELGIKDIEEYITKIVMKFANAVGKLFNPNNPILDSSYLNMRINAVHPAVATRGTTMAIRVLKPYLALNERNFDGFAPPEVLDFLKGAMRERSNVVISGETGCGKTELHKLLFSFVNPHDRICLIEDIYEMHLKELYPDLDVYAWLINKNVPINDLIKSGLRNNPNWLIVSETRGCEAYEMLQAVLTGHSIVTSVHAAGAQAITRRFTNMCLMNEKNLNEEMITNDILEYFSYGVHLKKVEHHGRIFRYLEEIVAFSPTGTESLFKQHFKEGELIVDYQRLHQLA
ncbi:MAG: Flp pilus assembly complex ATPase component TadA [Lactobacillales bacterium]|jgi:pilus assembly protein CpaF|nr:Flp pilus assembly complex ATPase component TadA [Lactobacillales bacterium]